MVTNRARDSALALGGAGVPANAGRLRGTEANMDRIAALRCVHANGWWNEFCRENA